MARKLNAMFLKMVCNFYLVTSSTCCWSSSGKYIWTILNIKKNQKYRINNIIIISYVFLSHIQNWFVHRWIHFQVKRCGLIYDVPILFLLTFDRYKFYQLHQPFYQVCMRYLWDCCMSLDIFSKKHPWPSMQNSSFHLFGNLGYLFI